MEQKNVILAVVLSVTFLFLWSVFVVPRITPPSPPAQTPTAQTPPDTATPGTPPQLLSAHALRGEIPALGDSILRDEQNEIVLTPQGGAVRDWRVKLKDLEVDLVDHPDVQPLPLATFSDTVFKINQGDRQAVMTATLPSGVRLTKTLALSGSPGFLHDLIVQFDNPTSQPVELKNWEWGWGPGLGTTDNERKENARLTRALTLSRLNVHAIKEGDHPEFGRWVGIDNRYFLVAFVPVSPHVSEVTATGSKDQTRLSILETTLVPAHGQTILHYQLYAGPKGYTQLKKYGKGLEEGVDFGTFSPLGKLILSAIYRLRGWTGNYGWAIVILTIGLQVLMMPLTMKSFKATLAMKKLQPQIAALQAQYKSDPKRLNIEMMNLYKKSGTNPFGGCLPMLLQLPIFWALFTTLRNAYELHGAPFVGWIHDLSAADPLHILPIVMGGAMFLQQRMSGAVTDPTQRQMMFIMPIMFTVMFFNFPAGLVLYWLTNNLLTMAFQWTFIRYSTETPRVVETTLVK